MISHDDKKSTEGGSNRLRDYLLSSTSFIVIPTEALIGA